MLPRLNATDIKFLYGVNKETRALVKRSTRADALKKKFNIGEMSSISTLEVAWEHYPWVRLCRIRILRPKDGRTTVLLSSCSNE